MGIARHVDMSCHALESPVINATTPNEFKLGSNINQASNFKRRRNLKILYILH